MANDEIEQTKPEQKPVEEPKKEPTLAQKLKAKQKELEEREASIKKQEEELRELTNEVALGGRSVAGTGAPPEESPKDYAKRVMRGDFNRDRRV